MSTIEGQPGDRPVTHIVDANEGCCRIYNPKAIEANQEAWLESDMYISRGDLR